jgi:hypothetical protein
MKQIWWRYYYFCCAIVVVLYCGGVIVCGDIKKTPGEFAGNPNGRALVCSAAATYIARQSPLPGYVCIRN